MISLEDAILVAVAQGVEDVDGLVEILKVSREDVAKAIDRLVRGGYLRVEESGWWIFKKRKLVLTERGFERASRALEQLKSVAQQVKEKIERGEREYIDELFLNWSYILPLLVWLDLVDLMLIDSLIAADLASVEEGYEEVEGLGDVEGYEGDVDVV